jgi:ParG
MASLERLTDFLNVVASAEDWTAAGADEWAALPGEPMKRFTVDVPVELHRRVSAACAKRGLKTSSVLRDLLEREFPETSGQFRLPL